MKWVMDSQVYRATLVTGERVAVKVQRPDVLESVTLDLYVIRILLLLLSKNKSTRESALSILGVIDNWANRFLQELDYLQEAANGDRWDEESMVVRFMVAKLVTTDFKIEMTDVVYFCVYFVSTSATSWMDVWLTSQKHQPHEK